MLKYLYVALGLLSLTLGLLGIFTPGLPTTPFILLTGFLFAKGSPRLHKKLLENKITGYYLNKINTSLSFKTCLISIALMWVMVSITAFAVFDYGTKRYIMIGAGIAGTIAQLIVFRRKRAKSLLMIKSVGEEHKPRNNQE